MRHRTIDSPIGPLTLVVDDQGHLTGLYSRGQRHHPDPAGLGVPDPTAAAEAVRQVSEYFAGTRDTFDLDLRPAGTAFQRRVWDLLCQIPAGARTSYGELARLLGSPQASRAVGAAVGRNPISIIIPCHRVVGGDGSLTGYAGGIERKRWLLDHELRACAGA